MRIANNIMAMNTHRVYSINNTNISKSIEKLSSGYRINRAGDDAAGLAISEKMRAQIRGLQMASKNSQDAISMVQTAEGALQTTHDILQRMREIAVQSASDTNETSIDRAALDKEFQALKAEIDDTADKTAFNDQKLIDGTFQKSTKSVDVTGVNGKAKAGASVNTAVGDYTISISDFAAATDEVTTPKVGGAGPVAPTGDASKLAGQNAVDQIVIDFAAGPPNTEDVPEDGTTFTLKDDTVSYDADSNAVSFTLVAGTDSNEYFAAFNLTLDADGKTTGQDITLNIGDGAEMTLTVGTGFTGEQVAASIQSVLETAPTFDLTNTNEATWGSGKAVAWVEQASAAGDWWTDGGQIPTGELLNGDYTFAVDTSGGLDAVTFSLTGDNGEVKTVTVDLSALEGTTLSAADVNGSDDETLTLDFGDALGTLDIHIDFSSLVSESDGSGGFQWTATSVTDFLGKLSSVWSDANGNNVVEFSGGANQETETTPATDAEAKLSIGGVTVDLKEGMTELSDPFVYDDKGNVVSGTGVYVKFDHALTAADFEDEETLSKAIFGSENTTGTATISVTEDTSGKDFVVQTGANEGDELSINIDAMNAWTLGIDQSNIGTREAASKAITEVNNAINKVSMQRADLGALQNRLEFKIQNLDISAENLQSAESRIRDLDMAAEMTTFTRNNILAQAATAMLAQANSLPQGVLQLLG